MPTIPRANTNLTTIMVAERMADRIIAGPDGAMWITASASNVVVRWSSKSYTTVVDPTMNGIAGIAAGADGNIWVANRGGNSILEIDPSTLHVTNHTDVHLNGVGAMTTGPDGNVWFTNSGSIGFIDTGAPTRVVAVSWGPTDTARVQQVGRYLGQSPQQVQKTGVFLMAFLLGFLAPAVTPVSSPPGGTAATYVTSWGPSETSALDTVRRRFALDDAGATRYSFGLLSFLLGLQGH